MLFVKSHNAFAYQFFVLKALIKYIFTRRFEMKILPVHKLNEMLLQILMISKFLKQIMEYGVCMISGFQLLLSPICKVFNEICYCVAGLFVLVWDDCNWTFLKTSWVMKSNVYLIIYWNKALRTIPVCCRADHKNFVMAV